MNIEDMNEQMYMEWASLARNALYRILGDGHPSTIDFVKRVSNKRRASREATDQGIGILRAVVAELKNGQLMSRSNGNVDSDLVVVIAPSKLEDNFEIIATVCKGFHLNASRVEHKGSSAPIVERIFKSLQEARFVVADLTSERPNVYYELGYLDAICWARDVDPADRLLIIAQREADIHFDIQHRGVQRYDDPVSLLKLASRWFDERTSSTDERE